jgi:hypothetical protein
MKSTLFFDNFHIALSSIRSNLLRTILTILIITIGITALVGPSRRFPPSKMPLQANSQPWAPILSPLKAGVRTLESGKKPCARKTTVTSLSRRRSNSKSNTTSPPSPPFRIRHRRSHRKIRIAKNQPQRIHHRD